MPEQEPPEDEAEPPRVTAGTSEPEDTQTSPRPYPNNAMMLADTAITQLKKIHPKDTDREQALRKVNEWTKKQLEK
jgi:hypothetical protein